MDALGREMIALQQVENRDPPLLLDVGRAPADAVLVERHVDDPRVGHRRPIVGDADYDNYEFVRRGRAGV